MAGGPKLRGMNDRFRLLGAVGFSCLLFLAVQIGALSLVEPFTAADMQAVDDPEDPTYSLLYVLAILVATAFMLAAFRYGFDWIIRGLIIGVSVMLAWFVFAAIIPLVTVSGVLVPLPLVAALAVGLALLTYPEWYVIDVAGVIMGAGAAGLFGISLGLLPVIVLLVVLAVYDAISVYRTEHMLDLADGVMDLRIPVVLVVPTTLSYTFLSSAPQPDSLERSRGTSEGGDGPPVTNGGADDDQGSTADTESPADSNHESAPEPEAGRDALFIGLGDAVIPTILVASAATFVDAGTLEVPLIALNVPALGAMLGTLLGLLGLLYAVLQGRAHAGLPLLNGGAMLGYLAGALWVGVPLLEALGI